MKLTFFEFLQYVSRFFARKPTFVTFFEFLQYVSRFFARKPTFVTFFEFLQYDSRFLVCKNGYRRQTTGKSDFHARMCQPKPIVIKSVSKFRQNRFHVFGFWRNFWRISFAIRKDRHGVIVHRINSQTVAESFKRFCNNCRQPLGNFAFPLGPYYIPTNNSLGS